MKVVIVGAGKVGSSLAGALAREGHDVTVVDSNPDVLVKVQNNLDVMCIEGNGATVEVQSEAAAETAGLLIAATPYDELNILCCLIGKRLGADKTISRVRTPAYYAQMHLIRDDLRLSMIMNPELATADEIFRVLIFPAAAKVELFEKGRLELVEHLLPENSSLSGLSLQEIYKKVKTKVLICAVQRDEGVFIPDGNFVLKGGDWIHVAASHRNVERFFRVSGLMKERVRSVMIVGGGTTCYYLARQLIHMGMRLKIFERNAARCSELSELLGGDAVIIHGDGTDQELLIEEDIQHVDAFVALTDMDEENIILSLFAKDVARAKVITKIDRDNYLNLAYDLGLDCVISPKSLTTSNVSSYVRSLAGTADSEVESLYHLVENQVEAIEFRCREEIPGLTGLPLKSVSLKSNLLICTVMRRREILVPDGNTTIQPEDLVVVVSKDHHFTRLREILE